MLFLFYGPLIQTFNLLCEKGADIKISDKMGKTPLYWASRNGHYDIVETLCNKGASAETDSSCDESILTTACKEGRFKIVKLLLREALRNKIYYSFHLLVRKSPYL